MQPVDNALDDNSLMGYSSGTACFSYPLMALVKQAGAVQLAPADLPLGKIRSFTLRPVWANGPQVRRPPPAGGLSARVQPLLPSRFAQGTPPGPCRGLAAGLRLPVPVLLPAPCAENFLRTKAK